MNGGRTDSSSNDDCEDNVSDKVRGTKRRGDDHITSVSHASTPREEDRRHDGVPHADHDNDRHRRYNVHVL